MLRRMASDPDFDMVAEGEIFSATFQYLNDALQDKAFKRWNGNNFTGKFLMSVFEVLATGVSQNIDELKAMQPDNRNQFLIQTAQDLWNNEAFTVNSGAGVRGTTRLAKLLPIAKNLLNPNPQ